MSKIINRLRWLSLGVYIGGFIMCLIETYDDDKKIKKMVKKWPQPFDSGKDRPPLFTEYKHNHNKEA